MVDLNIHQSHKPDHAAPSMTMQRAIAGNGRLSRVSAAAGDWLLRHQGLIRKLQWVLVGLYLFLVAVPAFLPLPPSQAHIWNDLTLFAQFVFWGIWWPFVLLSMILVGRLWCGVFCPEGTLTEAVSRHGRGRAVPRFITWQGWPFVAFACTTAYGQFVSVYQYPKPTLLILGGSTVGAMIVGYLYGREKRVWCRYLCPVNGVFGLLAKLAPFHFRTDREAWDASPKPTKAASINCAPLVPIRIMKGASTCHMCGRCSGFRGSVALSPRSPNHEIVHVAGSQTKHWQTWLITFGLLGLATGAFHWGASAWYVTAKQWLAEWLINHDLVWPVSNGAPWWILTNYPEQNDTLTLLDGTVLAGYMLAFSLVIGGVLVVCLSLSASLLKADAQMQQPSWGVRFHHLAQSLIPLAGCNVFLGLFGLTTTMLHTEGLTIPFLANARFVFMTAAALWSVSLAWQICGLYMKAAAARAVALAPMILAAAFGVFCWAASF